MDRLAAAWKVVPTQRGVVTLLANTVLMSAGFTMMIPLISVHLSKDFGYTGAAIGAVLAVRQFTQQGLMMIGGALGDRWGHKPVICVGYLIRAFGFLGFGLATTLPELIAAAVVTALGGTFFEATSKAALAALVKPSQRASVFSIASLCGGVGLSVGPLLGVALLQVSFFWVGLVAAVCFFAAFVLSLFLLPETNSIGETGPKVGVWETLATVFKDTRFVKFTALLTGYWFLTNQVYISVPLYVLRATGDTGLVGVIFTVQAAVSIVLQVPLVSFLSRRLRAQHIIALGLTLMGANLGAMGLGSSGIWIVACSLGFAVGRVLVEPTKDSITAGMASSGAAAAYFGFGFLALAFGGTAGNYLGGWLMDVSAAPALASVPWITFAVVGLVGAVGLLFLRIERTAMGAAGPSPASTASR